MNVIDSHIICRGYINADDLWTMGDTVPTGTFLTRMTKYGFDIPSQAFNDHIYYLTG